MEPLKLTENNLLTLLEEFTKSHSSSDNMTKFMNSPLHVLVYNEMSRYSKKELESITYRGEANALYKKVLATRNPLFFCCLIEKKAFQKELSMESTWLLNNIKKQPELYDAVFDIQRSRAYYSGVTKNEQFNNFMYYLYQLTNKEDTKNQQEIADNFYNKFSKKYKDEIIEEIFKNIKISTSFNKRLIEKYTEDGIDINKNDILGKYIQGDKNNTDKYTTYFISSTIMPQIKELLLHGFRPNEDDFSHHGENLMVAVLKSKRKDIVETILPYLTMREPKTISMDEQHKLIDLYQQSSNYQEIKAIYYQKYYEYLLDKNPEKKDSIKIKI